MEDQTEIEKDAEERVPICSLVAQRGIKTSSDFAEFMSGLMTDIIEGSISPKVAMAACKAGDNLLKVVRMQHEYGDGETPIGLSGKLIGTSARKSVRG